MCFSDANLKKIAFYKEHYQIIVDSPLVNKSLIRLQDKGKRLCRFCGKDEKEVTFKNKAHAIPELLGNKSIISMNECDKCNEFFAKEYEDHLAKWFGPGRSLTQMHGKKGVPKFKTDDFHIEMGEKGLAFTITTNNYEKINFPQESPFEFKFPVKMPTQPYIPIRAAKALIKSAISILPYELLPECEKLIAWLLNKDKATLTEFPILYSFTPGVNPYAKGKVIILKRKSNAQLPYLFFLIAIANHRFQVLLPFCKSDTWMKNGRNTFTIMPFPVPFDIAYEKKYGETKFYWDNWASEEPMMSDRTASFHVERAERIK